jgi:hypothetical protein
MLRQKAQLLLEHAYDAECRGQCKRSERFTSQAASLNCAAGFLADCPAGQPEPVPDTETPHAR